MCDIYDKLKQAPAWALRPIQAGRLKGKTDINPQWRYEALTEVFGTCGKGWKYEVLDFQTVPSTNGEIAAFASINLYVKIDDAWSDPIPGVGGSMFVEQEKNGLHTNDECYKMAVTDALSVATKMLGMAADVYKGLWDGTKYKQLPAEKKTPTLDDRVAAFKAFMQKATLEQMNSDNYKQKFNALCKELGADKADELTTLHNNRMIDLAEREAIQAEGANA
jgi:hypothetical protein